MPESAVRQGDGIWPRSLNVSLVGKNSHSVKRATEALQTILCEAMLAVPCVLFVLQKALRRCWVTQPLCMLGVLSCALTSTKGSNKVVLFWSSFTLICQNKSINWYLIIAYYKYMNKKYCPPSSCLHGGVFFLQMWSVQLQNRIRWEIRNYMRRFLQKKIYWFKSLFSNGNFSKISPAF